MNDVASFNAFADAQAQFDRLADLMGTSWDLMSRPARSFAPPPTSTG
jgi:hypothetical protein